MKYIVDRFENDYAIIELESGDLIDIPKKCLPDGTVAGAVIEVKILQEKTTERSTIIKEKMTNLFRKD